MCVFDIICTQRRNSVPTSSMTASSKTLIRPNTIELSSLTTTESGTGSISIDFSPSTTEDCGIHSSSTEPST